MEHRLLGLGSYDGEPGCGNDRNDDVYDEAGTGAHQQSNKGNLEVGLEQADDKYNEADDGHEDSEHCFSISGNWDIWYLSTLMCVNCTKIADYPITRFFFPLLPRQNSTGILYSIYILLSLLTPIKNG
jgi:hypothetical protein